MDPNDNISNGWFTVAFPTDVWAYHQLREWKNSHLRLIYTDVFELRFRVIFIIAKTPLENARAI